MPRTSTVHYIAPASISLIPNANGSENDLAVYIAKGAKIKVYSPGITELGLNPETDTYREWTFAGRNRRLADSLKKYTIYARLRKDDAENGYLVFAPQTTDGKDRYPYVTKEGLATGTQGIGTGGYWYVRLGEVSLPENGQRTVTLDTGILGTDRYNEEWEINPDELPVRVELGCTVNDEDAGTTPYVYWGQQLVLTASLIRGWGGDAGETVHHWTIVRNTGNTEADEAWNGNGGEGLTEGRIMTDGQIVLIHNREGADDFSGAVSAAFAVTAWGEDGMPIAKATITILAETEEAVSYDIEFSDYVDVITVDDAGNCIGGIYTDSGGGNRSYRIHSAITVRKNGVPLLWVEPEEQSDDDVVAPFGYYKIYGEGRGCSFVIENSTLYITAVDNIKDGVPGTPDDVNFDYDAMRLMSSCSVDLIIDCEGVASVQKRFPVTIKHDSMPYVAAELSSPMSTVKWMGASYTGLPITLDVSMSHNSEHLDIASADDISVMPSITGMVFTKSIATETDGGTTYRKGRVTITALPESLDEVTRLLVTCSAVYSGVSYERTLAHVITRVQDGVSVDSYIESQEAWGDSTTSYPQLGWSDSTPAKNGKYLWRRTRKMVLDAAGVTYVPDSEDGDHDGVADGEWKYQRLSGTDGTSIETRGTVDVVSAGSLPTEGVSAGDLGIRQGSGYVYVCAVMQDGHSLGWNSYAQVGDGDSYSVSRYNSADLEGDGIAVNLKGHLVMWSAEAQKWIDLGQFKGDPGITYFTHIAWADSTSGTFSGGIPLGQISTPNKGAVGHFSITPREGYDWMGLLINQSQADPTAASKTYYTWQYTKGAKGEDAVMYWLEPSAQTIRVEGSTAIPSTFSVRLMETRGGVTRELTALPQGLSDGMRIEVYADGTLLAAYDDDSTPAGFFETYGQGADASVFVSRSYMEFRLRARSAATVYNTKTITRVLSAVSWKLSASATHFRFSRDYAGVLSTGAPSATSLRVVRSEGRDITVYDTPHAALPEHIHLGWISPNHAWASAPSLGPVNATTLMTYIGNTLFAQTAIGLYSGGTVQNDYTVSGGTLIDQLLFTSEVTYQRMLIPQGEWNAATTYSLTDRTCPLVLYKGRYYFLLAESSTNNTPAENASNDWWALAEDYEVLLTKALFAQFANVGGFIFCENWFISQYGRLASSSGMTMNVDSGNVATPYGSVGGDIASAGAADMRAPYGWFDYADPMGTGTIPASQLRFIPALAMHAVTGENFLAGGKVHFSAGGDVSVEGTIKATNLYRNVCLFRQDSTYSNDCYFCYHAPSGAFTVNEYYTAAEIARRGSATDATFPDPDIAGRYRPCFLGTTYDADVVVAVPGLAHGSDGGWHTDRADENFYGPLWPLLPSPSDFVGKLVEVSGWSRSVEEKDIHVGCVVGNAMSNGIAFDGSGNFAFANAADEITIRTGAIYKFLAMSIGNATRWVLMG